MGGRCGSLLGLRGTRAAPSTGTAETTVELFRYDFVHLLGHQTDDQVDDALLVASAATSRPRLLIFDDAAHLLRNQTDNGIDDPLFLEVAVSVIVVMMVMMIALPTVTLSVMIVFARASVFVARAHHTLQRVQPFKNLTAIVVTPEIPPQFGSTMAEGSRASSFRSAAP